MYLFIGSSMFTVDSSKLFAINVLTTETKYVVGLVIPSPNGAYALKL